MPVPRQRTARQQTISVATRVVHSSVDMASANAVSSDRGLSGGGVGCSQGIGTAASSHRFASGQADR